LESNKLYEDLIDATQQLQTHPITRTYVNELLNKYIIDQISEKSLLELIKGKKPVEIHKILQIPEGLEYEAIHKQALKILRIMKDSKDWEDFEKKATPNKDKKPKKPITDFDKILKGIMKVPKPDREAK
jgi:hypothetical protein